jgi:hypothetical protein
MPIDLIMVDPATDAGGYESGAVPRMEDVIRRTTARTPQDDLPGAIELLDTMEAILIHANTATRRDITTILHLPGDLGYNNLIDETQLVAHSLKQHLTNN